MSALWAITSFFNPAGYRRRVENYRVFRERLRAPLIAVELSFTGAFALRPGDAEVLVQLDRGDILFQKERLLNIALRHLPPECEAVAWLDCDVIFGSDDWTATTLEALERFAVAQPFSERYDLAPEARPEDIEGAEKLYDRLSLMATIAREGLTGADFRETKPPLKNPAWGLAWAARRDVLDKHGLYDACVFTSGDIAMFCAAAGAHNGGFMRGRMNERSFRHYAEWAGPFHETVRGSVGHVDGRLYHLWHGGIAERRYGRCHEELRDLGFDPYTDIAMTDQGAWRWCTDKPELHARLREYFHSREEDAEPSSSAAARRAPA
ncbi:MAG: hypothetical protein KIT09_10670 [Bryobacteraceae bacterium]|nr:hypothetical protein [Bryobacteraceae bacterium]